MGHPKELGRRLVTAVAMVLLPLLASSTETLWLYAGEALRKIRLAAAWGGAVFEVFGASTFFLLSVACAVAATVVVAVAVKNVVAGRDDALERQFMLLRALVILHGAAAPFLALSATQHLSPTVRGRLVLARYLDVVLEHQAFVSFAAAAVGAAWIAGSTRKKQRPDPEVATRLRAGWVLVGGFVASGLVSRVLAQTFTAAARGAGVASTLEVELAAGLVGVAVTVVAVSLVAPRQPAPVAAVKDDEATPPVKPLKVLARTLAILLLPLFSLTVVSWASSRPCEPNADELAGVPTVPAAATLPLPLARAETESTADEGVLVADAGKRLREMWPKHAGAHVVRLVVQRDAFERGRTGVFARFGDGRFGVIHLTFADRDALASCPAGTKCVEVSADTMPAALAAIHASLGTPSFVYRAGLDETVGALAADATALLRATYDSAKSNALDLGVDILVTVPPEVSPKTRAPAPVRPTKPHVDAQPVPLRSAGCAVPHAAASFEPHEVAVDGASRKLFVSAPPASEGPRSLVVVLPADGSSADEARRVLALEPRAGATNVFLYLEPRAKAWDVEASLASNPDVAFVRAAIGWAESSFCVDPHEHTAIGLGAGGVLANALACNGGFSAVITHASPGPAPTDDEPDAPSGLFRCKSVAALAFQQQGGAKGPVADGTSATARWRAANHCAISVLPSATEPACKAYVGCDHPVEHCAEPTPADAASATALFLDARH